MLNLLLLLLPMAAALGWYLGRREPPEKKSTVANALPPDYFVGLNYLLNEQPDKATDIFIHLLTLNKDTIQAQLAAGHLLRRKGKVDNAIRLHQQLIAKPNLSDEHRSQALLELAQDYFCAGVLDRAERLFLEIVQLNDAQRTSSLRFLLDIYQRERNWLRAIDIAQQLEIAAEIRLHKTIAHYYCELAASAQQKNTLEEAQRYLKQALAIDPHCGRATLLLADIAKRLNDYSKAIYYYKKIKEQDVNLLVETVHPLLECYQHISQPKELLRYLLDCFHKVPQAPILLAVVECIQQQQGKTAASEFLYTHLQQNPSLNGLAQLIQLQQQQTPQVFLDNLQTIIQRLIAKGDTYRCHHCGFVAKQLIWCCPACREWGSIKPN